MNFKAQEIIPSNADTPKLSRRDSLKVFGMFGIAFIFAACAQKNWSEVTPPKNILPPTENMKLAVGELGQLFPQYLPELQYLRAGKDLMLGDGSRQIDNYYVIFHLDKTFEQFMHGQKDNPKDEILIDSLIKAQDFNKNDVRPDGKEQYAVAGCVTTEEIRRSLQDHQLNHPETAEKPNSDFIGNIDIVRVAVQTSEGEILLLEPKSIFGSASLAQFSAITDDGSYAVADWDVLGIDTSKRMSAPV